MERNFKFAVDEIQKINIEDYADDEFAIARMGFLSDRPNSHGLKISETVLRESAKSVLGKWVVADMSAVVDSGTHTDKQKIVGRIPENQDIEFIIDEDGYTRAYVDTVISKIYAKDYCAIFENDNNRAVSVEMKCDLDDEDDNLVLSFNIVGVTTLGHLTRPSCPNSDITFTRFSEDDANNFFTKVQNNRLTALERFAEERKQSMAEKKSYKLDKSKEAMSTDSWSDVNKTDLRNKIIEAKNANTLVKSVYLKVDADWQSAPSEKLHYPVMQFKGDTLVYNRNALANAKARAVQNNESEVVKKIDKIYKLLDIGDDNEGKEETAKMSKEIEFAAVDIGDMWSKLWSAIRSHDSWRYSIEGIYEEDNKKFAVLKEEDGTLYRLDFSLTEDGITVADELVKVKKEFIETDKVVKFAEPENVEDYRKFADDDDDDDDEIEGRKAWAKVIKKVQDHEGDGAYVDSIEDNHIIYTKNDVRYRVNAKIKTDADDKTVDAEIDWDSVKKDADQKMSADEMETVMAQLKKDIEERDNIIMDKDAELEELRSFKKNVEEKEKAISIESVLSEIKEFVNEEKLNELRNEGLNCQMSEVDGWANKVKAMAFDNSKDKKQENKFEFWSFAAPVENNKRNDVWGRL